MVLPFPAPTMSMQLRLEFLSLSAPSLEAWYLSHNSLPLSLQARRGGFGLAVRGRDTFPWSAALQALSLLVVGTKLAASGSGTSGYHLAGERGSLASSLELISKIVA